MNSFIFNNHTRGYSIQIILGTKSGGTYLYITLGNVGFLGLNLWLNKSKIFLIKNHIHILLSSANGALWLFLHFLLPM